ncbi:phytanoyl-CoA dioxygenase family protein [Paraburkholderia fungorum]|uniref:phytanoyl-CoA dioxygenase family protein n=1 Tax=Paraburkholderia fungorum TaxID=134537 RepID=UPI0038B744AA
MKKTIASVEAVVDQLSSETFDLEIFREAGLFVMRNAIPPSVVKSWQEEWTRFYDAQLRDGRNVNRANPVSLTEQLPEKLACMYREPVFANTLKHIFGNHIALYNHRFVIKDRFSSNKVFLHQDSCYHLGNLNKCSLFVPLTVANADNGGMTFHAGSHKLGVLGDAGEIDPDSFEFDWPKVTPELQPGDFVIMNSSLWHESGPNVSGINRIMADTIVQPADDPTGKELLCGDWQTEIFYSPTNYVRYFVNSRVLKIIKYEKERAAAQI